jgi:hypothetical protein
MLKNLKKTKISYFNKVYQIFGLLSFDGLYEPPIFIVGTGRCGTSLLVKILNSHTQLIGFPGEANEIWHPKSFPFNMKLIETPPILDNPKKFTQISLKSWPDNYDKKIQRIFLGYKLLKTMRNKMPTFLFTKSAMISFMIPKILSIFPEAKFIHIYRNGPSVVASLVKKEWEKYHDCFNSKKQFQLSCAKYWNDCLMEIESQKNVLSLTKKGLLFELSYEELCDNPLEILNKLFSFLSVDFKKFNFDLTQIVSQNYKVGSSITDEKWFELMEVMSPGLELKGYVNPSQK